MDSKKNEIKNENTQEKKGSSKKKIAAAVIAVAIAAIAAVVIIFLCNSCGKDSGKKTGSTADSASNSQTASKAETPSFVKLVEDSETYKIDLGFIELRYPTKFKDSVTVAGAEKHEATDKFTVSFSVNNVNLFDLYFNDKKDSVLGTLDVDGNQVGVYVKTYVLKDKDAEYMEQQESLNVIIQALIADYGFKPGVEPEVAESNEVFEIKTDVVSLYYPAKWKDKVDVKVNGKTVSFENEGKSVFDIRFEECDGFLLGTYKTTPVYIVEHEAKNDEQVAMQQDVNVIISQLEKDTNFKIND